MEAVIEKSTLKFLKNLKLNNTREWFQDNHSQYVSAHENVLHFADAMIRKIEEFDGSIYGITAKESVFRIYKVDLNRFAVVSSLCHVIHKKHACT